jgi:choline dehydrogenase
VIGGTNTINTMIYMRGSRFDYDNWSADGNDNWSLIWSML